MGLDPERLHEVVPRLVELLHPQVDLRQLLVPVDALRVQEDDHSCVLHGHLRFPQLEVGAAPVLVHGQTHVLVPLLAQVVHVRQHLQGVRRGFIDQV
eukprot:6994959-Pyramimonas_sp.AAC.1